MYFEWAFKFWLETSISRPVEFQSIAIAHQRYATAADYGQCRFKTPHCISDYGVATHRCALSNQTTTLTIKGNKAPPALDDCSSIRCHEFKLRILLVTIEYLRSRSLSDLADRSEGKAIWGRLFDLLWRIASYLTRKIGKHGQTRLFRSRLVLSPTDS